MRKVVEVLKAVWFVVKPLIDWRAVGVLVRKYLDGKRKAK